MEDISIGVVVILMIAGMFASFIPLIPGPTLVWFFGSIYAIVTRFERITIFAVLLMTIFMAIGATADIWLRAMGVRVKGTSCWASFGSVIGGMLGTMLIPIPVLGTVIGLLVGALLVEFMRAGEWREAWSAGRSALELFVIGELVELSMSIMIVAIFIASAYLTA